MQNQMHYDKKGDLNLNEVKLISSEDQTSFLCYWGVLR